MSQSETNRKIRSNYSEMLRLCRPFLKKRELPKLRDAFMLVLDYHKQNWEETGEEYLYHSIEVAKIALQELNLGTTTVICSLLHNVVDGENVTVKTIRDRFGDEIAVIVEGYTRLSLIQTEKISIHSNNFRELYLSLVKDIRVILIKLAHRLYDMRDFEQLSEAKKNRYINEVNHIYIPIAHRLGLYHIKAELEGLWLKNTNPDIYSSIAMKIRESKKKQLVYIEDFINPLEKELIKHGFEIDIKGRPKSIHSIWKKMKKQNVTFDQVYDLFAVRVIIDTNKKNEKSDCWKVYSIVTNSYQPNPKRLRDWITTPKASGYESLHTTVMGPNGKWIEVQIRSKRMDEVAEQGLAAHWRYKEGGEKKEQEEWMNTIRSVIDNPSQKTLDKAGLAKIELYQNKIFVFTPEGDLKKLPAGATVLDFAYDIHTSVGDMCSGAKVNNRIVPIRYELQNGDKVEIITSKTQQPKLDWLNFVVTNKAKAKIKRSLKEEKYQEAELGKEILRRKLRNRKIGFTDSVIDKLIKHYELKSSIDLYYLIAIEKIDISDIKKTLEEDNTEEQPQEPEKEQKGIRPVVTNEADSMVIGDDIGNLNYELAKCCNPISGDAVFGFITVGKGITIHRKNCPNAAQLQSKYNYRIIDVKWRKSDENKTYLTTLRVTGEDRMGILSHITQIISNDLKVNMVSVNIESRGESNFDGRFKLRVRDIGHLNALIHKILKVNGVKKAIRLSSLAEENE